MGENLCKLYIWCKINIWNMQKLKKQITCCSSTFTVSVFTIARKWKQCLSTDEWMRKMWHIYTMYIWNPSVKKNEIKNNKEMDGAGKIILRVVNTSQKVKQHIFSTVWELASNLFLLIPSTFRIKDRGKGRRKTSFMRRGRTECRRCEIRENEESRQEGLRKDGVENIGDK